MDILFFYPRWGSDHLPWPSFLEKVKQTGYDGVEIGLLTDEDGNDKLLNLIEDFGLKFIIQHYETSTPDFDQHFKEFTARVERAAARKPFLINSHTGRDYFSFEQNSTLLYAAQSISQKYGVAIAHETHRGRFSFAAHVAQTFLQFDWMDLTLDISHWFCVAESMLEDQQAVLDAVIPHIRHIHARYGYTQSAQIINPREGQWQDVIERHLEIWDKIILHQQNIQTVEMGITTEFGPPPYLQVVPLVSRR